MALLEFAKDAIQTAVSNIPSVGANAISGRKRAERNMRDDKEEDEESEDS